MSPTNLELRKHEHKVAEQESWFGQACMQAWVPALPGGQYAEGKRLFSYIEQNKITTAFGKKKQNQNTHTSVCKLLTHISCEKM